MRAQIRIKIYLVKEWVDIDFKNIKKGHRFRLLDEGGGIVKNGEFVAKGDAHQDEDGDWQVER